MKTKKGSAKPRIGSQGLIWDDSPAWPVPRRQVELCMRFLELCKKTTAINGKSPGSYRVKHAVEAYFGEYISNGALIIAASAGFSMRPDGVGSLNAQIGISPSQYSLLERLARDMQKDRDRDSQSEPLGDAEFWEKRELAARACLGLREGSVLGWKP